MTGTGWVGGTLKEEDPWPNSGKPRWCGVEICGDPRAGAGSVTGECAFFMACEPSAEPSEVRCPPRLHEPKQTGPDYSDRGRTVMTATWSSLLTAAS